MTFINKQKIFEMTTTLEDTHSNDRQNKRIGIDRRQFSYTHHLPERRNGEDRRRADDSNHVSDDKK